MTLPRTPGRTTPAFGFSYIERSFKDCLGERQFGREETNKIVEYFEKWEPQPSCAFCGSTQVARWDHLVAVSEHGATMLGNMVLACSGCDDSKGSVPFDEWMLSNKPKSPQSRGIQNIDERIQRIKEYVQTYGYTATPLEQRLDEHERSRLSGIQTRLRALREEVDSLIADYRERTGHR